jgi:hypothetical protein
MTQWRQGRTLQVTRPPYSPPSDLLLMFEALALFSSLRLTWFLRDQPLLVRAEWRVVAPPLRRCVEAGALPQVCFYVLNSTPQLM